MQIRSIACLAACAWLLYSLCRPAAAANPPSIKLAMFDFELQDESAGPGESPSDTALLRQISTEARQLFQATNRYTLVDLTPATEEPVTKRWLHQCHGCDAAIAAKLGAAQSLVGFVTRISRTEYMITIQITDAKTGALLTDAQSGLRMGADYSWSRGVAILIKDKTFRAKNEDPK
jgi:hypothetical protein